MNLDVCIVTYDSAADLPGCLRSVADLEVEALQVSIVDNASRDDSADVAARWAQELDLPVKIQRRSANTGFAAGMNDAIAATGAPWVLVLNPDARPRPDYVRRLLARAQACDRAGLRVGALTGRLIRPENGGVTTLDACGMVLRRTWRHLDRGSGEPDDGRLAEAQQVFGATGAAALYRREALLDVSIRDGDEVLVFDPLFHSYREDAELCFRLHERGWSVVYEPAARCEHRRAVLPANRRHTSARVNLHSLKNRYLLRAYHETGATLWRTLPFALARDLAALLWVLVAERSSLAAYVWLWRQRRRWWARARCIRRRRIVSTSVVARWFSHPSLPLPDPPNPLEPT
ncbi:MAG: glycosyltransferase [Thermoanaerobaculia bacterium]|nr:glycosyltransferase [Thermoanaerobaculia bacterium]